jgi:hypothetical protein
MQIDVVPNPGSMPAILPRQRMAKTNKHTLANLSYWPAERIEPLHAVPRSERP